LNLPGKIYVISIVCIYKASTDIFGSLKFITDKFIEYKNSKDLINKLTIELGFNIV